MQGLKSIINKTFYVTIRMIFLLYNFHADIVHNWYLLVDANIEPH